MLRTTGLVAATALFAALASASPSPLAGTHVGTGSRVTASIDSFADRDHFVLDAPEGARITVSVQGAGKSPLQPTLELARPDGSPVNLATSLQGESTTAVSLPGLRAQATGSYIVTIRGFQGSAGDYVASFQVLVDTKTARTLVVPRGRTITVDFTALEGAAASFSAKETAGPALLGARITDPEDAVVAGSEALRRGSVLAARKVALDSGPGLYGIVLEGSPSGDTTVDLKASFKSPRVKGSKIRLGAEPRPASLAPATGRDGTAFTIAGTGFTEASRVFFEGGNEAAGVALTPSGDLTGRAPSCPTAVAGGDVAVTVVNPDGQSGALDPGFRFQGVPFPLRAEPPVSPVEGGTTVTVYGSEFRPGLAVLFDGVPASDVTLLNGGAVRCVTPPHASAPVGLEVVDEYGRRGALSGDFLYADPPAVASADPAGVPSFGGRTVTLTGTEFLPGDRVFVDGVEAGGVSVASRTTLAFVTPAGRAGDAAIEVRDLLGRSWEGTGILVLADSFQDVTATAVPAAGTGTVFPGASLALGDFTGDGAPDLVVATPAARANTVTGQMEPGARFLVNDGTGRFADGNPSLFPILRDTGDLGQADALAAGDLDGDGLAEVLPSRERTLLAQDSFGSYYGYPASYHMGDSPDTDWATLPATRIWEPADGGPFLDATPGRLVANASTPVQGTGDRWQASASALGDLDGDGSTDLLLVAKGRVEFGYALSMEWTYKQMGSYYYGYYYVPESVSISEGSVAVSSTRLVLNDGSGTLSGVGTAVEPLRASDGTLLDDFSGEACAAGDVDGDGVADAVVLSTSAAKQEAADGSIVDAPALRVLLADGSGGLWFSPASVPDGDAATGEFWQGEAVALGDLDGDGDLDLVVGREAVGYRTDGAGKAHLVPAIRILRNEGSGAFAEDTAGFLDEDLFSAPSAATILGARAVSLADLDGDGSLDLLLTSREMAVSDSGNGKGPRGLLPAGRRTATRVLLNDGAGRLSDATADRVPPPVGGDLLPGDALALRDLDGDGRPDLVISLDSTAANGPRPVRVLLTK